MEGQEAIIKCKPNSLGEPEVAYTYALCKVCILHIIALNIEL